MTSFASLAECSKRSTNPGIAAGILALIFYLIVSIPGAALELPIRIEAEHLIDFDDLDNPVFDPMHPDLNASNQFAADGFNREGQWCDYELVVEHPLMFQTAIRSAGSLELIREYYVTYTDYYDVVVATDTLITGPGLSEGT